MRPPRPALFDETDRVLRVRAEEGAAAGVMRWFVPGRIEVLGKHTDYAGGRSLLCAVERGFCVTARLRKDDRLRITDARSRSEVELRLSADQQPLSHWRNYPSTVARRVARNFGPGADTHAAQAAHLVDTAEAAHTANAADAADAARERAGAALRGLDIAIASDLPRASGLSSSSALIIAIFSVLAEANALRTHPAYVANIADDDALASYLGCIENGRTFGTLAGDRGVGTRGGSQDHLAIIGSTPGHIVAARFSPVRREQLLPVPDGYTFIVGSSGVTASKTGRALERYNRASANVATMLATWNQATGREDGTLFDALVSEPDAGDRLRGMLRRAGRDMLLPRLEQFRLETFELIPRAIEALAAGDVETFGAAVDRSHRAAVHLLGNQVPETIALAALAREIGAAAASAFGAGFGGSVWALVRASEAEAFMMAWRDRYLARFPMQAERAQVFATAAGRGRWRLPDDDAADGGSRAPTDAGRAADTAGANGAAGAV